MSDVTRAMELLDAAAADVSADSALTFERIREAQRLITKIDHDLNQAHKMFDDARQQWIECRAALAAREADGGKAVELPAALVVTSEGSHHDYYAEGWNDCRRKVRELAQPVAVPDGLWSFLRDVLRQGAAIESQQGQQGYETFISHIEAEACRHEKKLRAMLAAAKEADHG